MKKHFARASKQLLILMAVLVLVAPGAVFAGDSEYPTKTIKLVVPYGAGGASDLAGRIIAGVVPDYLGQAVIVVNKPGGSAQIGTDFVRKSKPNGYTMIVPSVGSCAIYPAMNTKLPFSAMDMTYVARTQLNPFMLIVNSKSPWKSFADMAAALKKNPGKYTYSTASLGTSSHLGGILILKELGLPITAAIAVHYDGDGQAVLAVAQGEADFYLGNLTAIVSSLKGGLVKGLAAATPEKLKAHPDVPTFEELGYPNIALSSWRGIAGPPNLPPEIVKKWEDAISKMVKSKNWLKLVTNLGAVPAYMNSADFTKFQREQFDKYHQIFSELGLLIK